MGITVVLLCFVPVAVLVSLDLVHLVNWLKGRHKPRPRDKPRPRKRKQRVSTV